MINVVPKDSCDHCGFLLKPGLNSVYVEDDEGKRVPCGHPCEYLTIAHVLGISKNAGDRVFHGKETYRRTPFLLWWIPGIGKVERMDTRRGSWERTCCTSCLHQWQRDPDKDPMACPKCGKDTVQYSGDLIGKQCPKCGVGTIRSVKFGLESLKWDGKRTRN